MIARRVGRRISWWQVPKQVRAAVESSLGSVVVEAMTEQGGFSPGAAARVRLANGRRAFVKALSMDLHSGSVGLYRNEAAIMPHLPADLPVPRLLYAYDDRQWVALVYEDVEGRHPAIPWRPDELKRVVAAIAELGAALDPSPWPAAPAFREVNSGFIEAWRTFATSPPRDLDSSVLRLVNRLSAEVDLAEVVRGKALLHNDIRSDNLLLTPGGRVVFLDWGMPCQGAIWQDLMMFILTADPEGGVDADLMVRTHPLTREIAESSIDVVVAAGYAAYRSLAERQVNPLVPSSNGHHMATAAAALTWLQRRAANE